METTWRRHGDGQESAELPKGQATHLGAAGLDGSGPSQKVAGPYVGAHLLRGVGLCLAVQPLEHGLYQEPLLFPLHPPLLRLTHPPWSHHHDGGAPGRPPCVLLPNVAIPWRKHIRGRWIGRAEANARTDRAWEQ